MERNRLANALSLSDEFRTICRARSARRFEQGRRVVALVSFCNRTRVCRNPTLTLRPRGHPNTGAPGSTFFGRPPLTPRTLNDVYHRKSSTATTGRVETLGRGRPCRITGEGLSPARSCRSAESLLADTLAAIGKIASTAHSAFKNRVMRYRM